MNGGSFVYDQLQKRETEIAAKCCKTEIERERENERESRL